MRCDDVAGNIIIARPVAPELPRRYLRRKPANFARRDNDSARKGRTRVERSKEPHMRLFLIFLCLLPGPAFADCRSNTFGTVTQTQCDDGAALGEALTLEAA
jgi:hypothetical protein